MPSFCKQFISINFLSAFNTNFPVKLEDDFLYILSAYVCVP